MHGYSSAIMWGAFTILLLVLLLKNSNNSTSSNNTAINDYNDNYSSNNGESTIKKVFAWIWDFFTKALAWVIFLGIAGIILWFLYETYSFIAGDITNSSSTQQTSIKGVTIVDGDYLPSYKGTYLFTAEANKTYRIQVKGCGTKLSMDHVKYGKYTLSPCADGKVYGTTRFYTKANIAQDETYIFPNGFIYESIILIKDKKRVEPKLIGNSLTTLFFSERKKVFLSYNATVVPDKRWTETPFGTGWRVVVTEE